MAEGLTKKVAEEAIDVVADEAKEVVEVIADGFDGKMLALGLALGFAGGAAIGYYVAVKRVQKKYEKLADEEIAEVREFYHSKMVAAEPKPSLKEMGENLGYATKEVPEEPSVIVSAGVEPGVPVHNEETRNVFSHEYEGAPGPWDYEKEVASREGKDIYIIHKDEWIQGNFQGEDHEQVSLTYFAEDDVLTGENDMPIADIDGTVGLEHLEFFGHGSEDPLVLYIRNEAHKNDYEITRSSGSFAKEVGNVVEADDELQHSAMRRHRPRDGDDD